MSKLTLSSPPRWLGLVFVVLLCSCAHIPKERYGVDRLKFTGMEALDSNALRACLATEQREKLTLGLGALVGPSCGDPPFDRQRWSARLFALPWTDWPVYDEAIFKLDLDRMGRWYQARGFYGARIVEVRFSPDAARTTDACQGSECEVDITVKVDEGKPVRVRKLKLSIEGKLGKKLTKKIYASTRLEKGEIFDESHYDRAQVELARVLREAGYARAEIKGEVVINRGLLVADIHFNITPGPVCRFGEVRLVSQGKFPEAPVRAVTFLRSGALYRESALEDAQRSIYALGAFSSVTVRGELDKADGAEIPVVIELEPRRESQIAVGAGIMSGISGNGVAAEEGLSIPQWDIHLLSSYDNRNFFGGLRRFRIEERPRMLFLSAFPGVPDNSPRFGNVITASFSQPGVIDPRTNLFLESRWDYGPDPFLLFFRNDVELALGLERGFFKQKLVARMGLHVEVMQVGREQPIVDEIQAQLEESWTQDYDMQNASLPEDMKQPITVTDKRSEYYYPPSSYRLPFLEQRLTLDLRDNIAKPTKGAFFRIVAQEAFQLGKNSDIGQHSWTYLRLTPEARGYVPVGLGMVLAARFAIGWLGILRAGKGLDAISQKLGPQSYRLRGGGANSNRGFGAGEMGDGRTGGTHRWEATVELRVPLSKDFYIVGFIDLGDVNAGFDLDRTFAPFPDRLVQQYRQSIVPGVSGFRFKQLNTTLGGGLRYYTVVGPIRLDVGARPVALGWESTDDYHMNLGFTQFRGAIFLTIGDAF